MNFICVVSLFVTVKGVQTQEILDIMEDYESARPVVTAEDISINYGLSWEASKEVLEELQDEGKVNSKDFGGVRVWWRVQDD